MAGSLALLIECLGKARQEEPRVDFVYLKIMDFYENGLYYESKGKAPVARQYYLKALALINIDVSRRQLTRLVVGGYDKWFTGIPAVQRGAD